MAAPKTWACQWVKGVFARLFLTLTAQTGGNIAGGTPVQGQDLTALVAAITAANQASTASGAVATPEQKVDNTKHMPPPPYGEIYTFDGDCIEGMFNQNGHCPE